jgi:competence protein ComEA
VAHPPEIRKIHLNAASAEELAGLLYLTPDMARALVAWRQQNGPFETLDDIGTALGLPREKIERIALYLTL